MKIFSLILTLAILTVTVLPCALTIAQSNHTPHENPAVAQTSYDIAMPILLYYGDILDLLANGEYGNIDALIDQLDLDRADIPEHIKIIMQNYNGLLSDLAMKLNDLNVLLDEANELLKQNKLEEIRIKLIDAGGLIEKINTLLEDTENTNERLISERLISLLEPFVPTTETDAVNKSRTMLLKAIERLKILEAEYEASLQNLETKVDQMMSLSLPNLTIVTPAQAWVGDNVTVSGILTSEEGGQALPNREITILLNGKATDYTAITDPDGIYQAMVDIPYLYIPTITVQASYVPDGNDMVKYLSTLSPVAEIEVQFYTTELTLNLDNTNPWVGDTITASGVLTSPEEEIPLKNRDITISLDGTVVSPPVTTGDEGSYEVTVNIPYLYNPQILIQARYIPDIENEGKYESSYSDPINMNISFYQTQLQIEVQEQAYPELPFKINGEITYDAGVPRVDRMIKVLWDNEPLDTFYLSQDTFEIEVLPDTETATVGDHLLTVVVDSHELYSSVSIDKTLIITKRPLEIEVNSLAFVIPPRKVKIEGKILSDLPLQEAMVSIKLRGISTTVSTSEDGKFEANLKLPSDSIVIGKQDVKITIEPSEAWHLTTKTKVRVFVIDIVTIGLTSAAFICIGMVLYTTRRGKPEKAEIEVLDPSFPPNESIGIAVPKHKGLRAKKAKVFKAYIEAMETVVTKTKVSFKPYMTLREFLEEVNPVLNGAAEPFTELTRLAENALYSAVIPDAGKVERAESLTLIIKDRLMHEEA